ncbi:hypothetical protein JNW90_01635 [Micromonospora sp. STR1s_5]|nr:hypothetical protein [Micromonospora sp. STR1s_5]
MLRGFAASHVWAEVPRVLAKRARLEGVPVEVLERIWWNDYVPLIRFVDCAGLPTTDQARRLMSRDESDANTLVLAGLLAPVVIIAEDRDILASGLAYEQWRDFYQVAETVHKGRSHVRAAATLTSSAGYGLAGVGKLTVRAARNPWLVAIAGLGVLLLYQSAGSWASRLRTNWHSGAPGRRQYAGAFGAMMNVAAVRVRQAETVWGAGERGVAGESLLHRMACVLATAETPMTRSQLLAELKLARTRSAMAELADLLYGHGAFHEVKRGRWQLGREKVDFGGLRPARPDDHDW